MLSCNTVHTASVTNLSSEYQDPRSEWWLARGGGGVFPLTSFLTIHFTTVWPSIDFTTLWLDTDILHHLLTTYLTTYSTIHSHILPLIFNQFSHDQHYYVSDFALGHCWRKHSWCHNCHCYNPSRNKRWCRQLWGRGLGLGLPMVGNVVKISLFIEDLSRNKFFWDFWEAPDMADMEVPNIMRFSAWKIGLGLSWSANR